MENMWILESAGGQGSKKEPSRVYLVKSDEARQALEQAEIIYEGEINLNNLGFCKMETQLECMVGSLFIPKLLDVTGSRYRIMFFINNRNIVIVDDSDFSSRLLVRINKRKSMQGASKEKFLYNFMAEFMSRDQELLTSYEKRLMMLEEQIQQGNISDYQSTIMPIRKELLTLRGYYDELADIGKELEENENHFFKAKQLKYFGTITDRANRLMDKTAHLLEYALQVQDAYQAQVDAKQNANMQFLTVISTIFFPLTLITGWYGMNFENMPELRGGYPGVIIFSVTVLIVCIVIFKRKKML